MTNSIPSPEGSVGSDREMIARALSWVRDDRRVALATVVETWGSSPRRPGAEMIVSDRREMEGSVSGGCVEGAVIEEAQEVLASGEGRTLEYGVSDEDAWAVGLACGGRVSVHVAPVDQGLLTPLLQALEARRSVGVETDPVGGERRLLDPFEVGPEEGELVLRGDAPERFVRVYAPPFRLVIVGAVHIAQPLAAMAHAAHFHCAIVDPRTAFASSERFAGVELLRLWPAAALEELGLDGRTAVVTLTHDPKLDEPALIAALESRAFYVGALGSRRTHARRLDRLRAAGVPDASLERIHAPVGLELGAETPAEIAVSILAQIVARRRGVA